MKKYIFFLITIIGGLILLGAGCVENSGYIKMNDCRNNVIQQPDDWGTFFHEYICSAGYCCRVDTDNSGNCQTSYCYTQTSTPNQ